jgi:DNA invertase Pin-like site-specific DNA recombinase
MERAIGYIRVSTEDQAREGVSLDVQKERIEAYCKLRGLDLVMIFRDNGVSAGKPLSTREGGAALLAALSRREATHVVALKLDRMFRSTIDCLENAQRWQKDGIALHLIDLGGGGAFDTASPFGGFFLTVMVAAAELERQLISERTRQALAHKKTHRQAYARTPIGYTRVGDDLAEDAGELLTVARILDFHASGASYNGIAEQLNAERIKTKRGGKWYASTVRYIVKNNLYQAV